MAIHERPLPETPEEVDEEAFRAVTWDGIAALKCLYCSSTRIDATPDDMRNHIYQAHILRFKGRMLPAAAEAIEKQAKR